MIESSSVYRIGKMYLVSHRATSGLPLKAGEGRGDPFSGENLPRSGRAKIGALLDRLLFASLLLVICLTAVPYGAADPWWESAFQCAVFALGVARVAHGIIGRNYGISGGALLLPPLLLACYSYVQTVPLVSSSAAGAPLPLSADPYGTWRFLIKLLALIVFGELLLRYTTSRSRLKAVVVTVISVGTGSAVFGLARYLMQDESGAFILAGLTPGAGFGQFLGQNHYAFLMEMSLGLAGGLLLMGVLRPRNVPFYIAAALVMWLSLVLTLSRGGISTTIVQAVIYILLFLNLRANKRRKDYGLRRLLRLGVQGILICALLTSVVLITLSIGGDKLATRVEQLSSEVAEAEADARAARRIDIWRSAWAMIREHPYTGVGFGAFHVAITEHHEASGASVPDFALNEYLELLAVGGVFGAAIFVWFVVSLARRAARQVKALSRFRRATCIGAIVGLVSVGVHSLVDSGLHTTINALVFTSLIVIVVAETPDENSPVRP
jgi:O-antigen ligase